MTRKTRIEDALGEAFAPSLLEVEDESHLHASGKGRESHFRVVIVSHAFDGVLRVERHRRVNRALADLFADGLHALSIHALTEAEHAERGAPASPACASTPRRDAS